MRRYFQVTAAVLLGCAVCAASAFAASRPSAITGGTSAVGKTSAVLHGTVNPHGNSTIYYFQWGPTSSYGTSGPGKSAGNGTHAISVAETADHLTPGTDYHFRLVASNASGTTYGADHAFKTAGAAVSTGPVTLLSSSGATLTGTVVPNGAKTIWYFQWGTTSSLSQQTKPQTLSKTSSPQSVSWPLQGLLNPGTVYQYRLVATHPGSSPTYGSTELFMTYPSVRPYAHVTAITTPRHRILYPYTFDTTGTISGPSTTPAQFACLGEVTLRFYRGTRQVRFETAPVLSNCTYSATSVFDHLPGGGAGPARLKLVVHFVSTPYLVNGRPAHDRVTIS